MKIFKKIKYLISFLALSCLNHNLLLAQESNIAFIVNSDNPITELNKETIALFYLKKVKFWPNNQSVRFFDRTDDSSERNYFLNKILSMTSREVDSFWISQKQNFGDSAPTQVNDDYSMAHLVSKFPESIGYVSSSFVETKGVKKINITGK